MEKITLDTVLTEDEYGCMLFAMGQRIDACREEMRKLGPNGDSYDLKRLYQEQVDLRCAYLKLYGFEYEVDK